MNMLPKKALFALTVIGFSLVWSTNVARGQDLTEGFRPPIAPYHGWYQPGTLYSAGNYLADYSNMNLDLGGTSDAQWIHDENGGESLMWSYGSNAPEGHDELYFHWRALPSNLTVTYNDGSQYLRSGFAMDEWLGGDTDEMRDIAVTGLRQAREEWPDVFIAAWFTDLSPQLIQLAKEGTVDLLVHEAYRTVPNGWSNLLYRTKMDNLCSTLKSEGLLEKTIVCHGTINGTDTDKWGQVMTTTKLEADVKYVAEKYPEMPGCAFFQGNSYYDPSTIALINKGNELFDTYYHRSPVPKASEAGTDKAYNDIGLGLARDGTFAETKDESHEVKAEQGNWKAGYNGAQLNNFQEYTHHYSRSGEMRDCVTLCVEDNTDNHGNVTVNTGDEVNRSDWPGDMHWGAESVTLMMGDYSNGVQCPELLWTAPEDGYYDVSAIFTNSSGDTIDTEAIVLINGEGGPVADLELREFDEWVSGYGDSTEYKSILALSAGDTVGFLAYSATGYALLRVDVEITATAIPEPVSLFLLCVGSGGLLAYRKRSA